HDKPVYLAETSLSLLFLLALLIRNLLFLNSINDPAVNIRAETVGVHLNKHNGNFNTSNIYINTNLFTYIYYRILERFGI
ncbi:hypothetical protein, partial [Mariniflexile maritimum]|uniref:hypothetical protein n=1 Tax=Mariniflexile maritimum TaxID=2682493 RepID=UPI001E44DD24